jgi:DNA-binding response OmpR family regulator
MLVTLRKVTFDLLLLDWHVRTSRAEVLDWVRAHLDPRIPVMFLTRRDAEADIVATLSAGADDYMVKPIRPANSSRASQRCCGERTRTLASQTMDG